MSIVLVARVYNEQQKVRAESIENAFAAKRDLISNEMAVMIMSLLFVAFLVYVLVRNRKRTSRKRNEFTSDQSGSFKKDPKNT